MPIGRALKIALAILGVGLPLLAGWRALREASRRELDAVASGLPHVPPGAGGAGAPPPQVAAELDGNGLFAALGRFTYRRRRWLPGIGIGLVVALNVWASQAAGPLVQGGWLVPGSEAQAAEQLIADRFGEQQTTMLVLFRDTEGDAGSVRFADVVEEAVAPLGDDPLVTEIVTYAETGDPRFVSRDRDWTFALVRLDRESEEAVEDAARLAELVERPTGVEVIVSGVPQVYHEFNEVVERDLVTAELVSLPIAVVILLAVFGTVLGAAVPLVVAAFALPAAMAAIGLLANVTEMSIYVQNVTTMIGLALTIDYALFMVSRFREELRRHPTPVAVERTMASVGKAVAVSGAAVAIGLSSLTVFESPALRSMGIAGVVTVVSTMLFGLTVLPAVLAMLGNRVNRLRIPLPRQLRLMPDEASVAPRAAGHGMWGRVARVVMRRPLLVATPVLVLLLVLGLPFLRIELNTGGNLDDLPPGRAVTGFEILRDEFPGGDTDPIEVAVRFPDRITRDGAVDATILEPLRAYIDAVRRVDGVKEVESILDPPPGMDGPMYSQLVSMPSEARPAEALNGYVDEWVAGDVARLNVFSSELPDSDAGRRVVNEIRALPPPDGAAEALTGGLSSRSRDFMASFDASVPWAVAIVVAVTAGVLFLTFGSVFLPIKAVLMSLLSIAASFGALVWIFQEGHLDTWLGFEASGTIMASTPVIMFAVLFGLSMDYEVLLLSRIRERFLATGDNTRAVAEGIGITGGIITGAALIMVAVFGAFALSSVLLVKALGFSMALAVLIDATIVRGILVPAFMRVMGSVNWWAPRWMQRGVARLGLYEGADHRPMQPRLAAREAAT